MDKLIDSRLFLKAISLVIALLLFISAPENSSIGLNTASPFTKEKETLKDVPLVLDNYDQENIIALGIPQSVDVTFKGPHSIITSEVLKKEFQIYVDLKDLEIGKHTIPVHYRQVSDKLDVSINPKEITVDIQEKITKELPVSISYVNEELIKPGYIVQDATLKPSTVKVVGPKDQMDKLVSVRAFIDLKDVDKSINKTTKLSAVDKKGNPLSVSIDPGEVKVEIPVILPSKKVPITLSQKGTPKDGINITEMVPSIAEATVYAPKDVVDKLAGVNLEVDISSITDSGTIEVPIPLPEGVVAVTPEKVKVSITVDKEEHKEVSNVPIKTEGLSAGFVCNFITPETGVINLDILGFQGVINGLTSNDVEAYIDVSNLSAGTYDVPIKAKGPQSVKVDAKNQTVKIKIAKAGS